MKKFPKELAEQILVDSDGYPHYRRRDDGQNVVKNDVTLDNRYFVPYNPYLSTKHNAHINVEICSSMKSCKYLYKYVYKGPHMASVAIEIRKKPSKEQDGSDEKEKDEIKKFVNTRFLTATEGYWRIFSFDTHGQDTGIQRLAVHEENTQTITFAEETLKMQLQMQRIPPFLVGSN